MDYKKQSAIRALDFVKSNMVVGLGSGSTATLFIRGLAEKIHTNELNNIIGIPTSKATDTLAQGLGISISSLAEHPVLDLAVDGADEVDPNLDLIKGLGQAFLREKIVEIHAKVFVVVVDESKIVDKLGTKSPLPVEITPFGLEANLRWLSSLGCEPVLWRKQDGTPLFSDNGNYMAKCHFPHGINSPHDLNHILNERPGIVGHGLFLNMAQTIIVSGEKGIELMTRVTK